MTFQEILAEVQKLSDEEKRLLVKTVSDDLSGIAIDVTIEDGDEVWSPEVESLQPFEAALKAYESQQESDA